MWRRRDLIKSTSILHALRTNYLALLRLGHARPGLITRLRLHLLVTTAAGLAALCGALVGLSGEVCAEPMLLPGSFDVSANGAAGYTIPIPALPGTAGMAPSLTLSYSSQSGNGLEGVGWSLGGFPAIGRCSRTMTQDGVRGSVNYDTNDRFCMEGQRLAVISGTYGADGSEYRTENEGFSKILAHGTAGNGPSWFEVHTKSGQIMEFGNTTDSRILAQGKTTARSWAASKISDTKGNYLTVTYQNDTTNGQAYPTRIDYTGNAAAGLSPYNSVQFVYETRPDIAPLYHAGSLQRTTVRLTDIRTYQGTTLYADYRLGYDVSPATANSRLVSVKACSDAALSSCLPPTTFAYSATTYANGGADGININGNQGGPGYGTPTVSGDFNGDGKSDAIACNFNYSNCSLSLSNGDGTFQTSTLSSDISGAFGGYQFTANAVDYNADGRAELLQWKWPNSGSKIIKLWKLNASGSFQQVATSGLSTSAGFVAADINGDGRTDTMSFFISPSSFLSNGDASFMPVWNATNSIVDYNYSPITGDFNGDSKTDALWISSLNRILCLSNGDGTFACTTNAAGADGTLSNYVPCAGDFNGDGKTDVLWFNSSSNSWLIWTSKGDGTFAVSPTVTDATLGGFSPTIADFNADGRTDIFWFNSSNYNRTLWLSNGDTTFRAFTNVAGQDGVFIGTQLSIMDVEGKGKQDLVWTGGNRALWLSDGVPSDLLTSWTTGLGVTTSVSYKPLTDGSVYTKDTTSSYPTLDMIGPMYVVSRVDAPNGTGGAYSSSYAYAGAKADLNGRGFLGFRQRVVTDLQTNVVETTVYRQDFPYIGLVALDTKTLGTQTLHSVTNSYGATNLGGTRNFVSLTQSVEASADLDGTALPTVTTSYQYDAYGNATQVTVSTPDGASKVTTSTYTNDTANWFLGRLTGASVTSTVP